MVSFCRLSIVCSIVLHGIGRSTANLFLAVAFQCFLWPFLLLISWLFPSVGQNGAISSQTLFFIHNFLICSTIYMGSEGDHHHTHTPITLYLWFIPSFLLSVCLQTDSRLSPVAPFKTIICLLLSLLDSFFVSTPSKFTFAQMFVSLTVIIRQNCQNDYLLLLFTSMPGVHCSDV